MHYFGKAIIALIFLHGFACGQIPVPSAALEIVPEQPNNAQHLVTEMFRRDKIKHFTSSLMLATSSGYYMRFTDIPDHTIPNYSMGFSFSLGIVKELYDRKRPGGDASWGDILADLTGTICGGILLHNLPH